jgi:D-3-phosphoglycerate dehydrogenase
MKILFVDTAHPLLQSSLEKEGHTCIDGTKLSRAEVLKTIYQYEGVTIRSRILFDKEMIDAATSLKFIARAGAGMETIDVKYAESKGIKCFNSPEGNRDAVGEHAIGMLLMLFDKLNKADREVREGKWNREANRGVELQGKTVGIIGYGNMGSTLARKLQGFEVNLLAYDKYKKGFGNKEIKESSMEEVFEHADILSLHIPLSAETEFLVNDDLIKRFKKNIYIINTARGKCLKTDDLVKNMKTGKVLGACLDVLEYEDTSYEKFAIENSHFEKSETWQYLINSDKVVLSPHIAGWTVESLEKIAKVLFEKIKSGFAQQKK